MFAIHERRIKESLYCPWAVRNIETGSINFVHSDGVVGSYWSKSADENSLYLHTLKNQRYDEIQQVTTAKEAEAVIKMLSLMEL